MWRQGTLVLLVVGMLTCSDDAAKIPPPTDPQTLAKTVNDLATLGPKHVGTPTGAEAGDYVSGRMSALGLKSLHFETFQFPRQDIGDSQLQVTVSGAPLSPPLGFDVFDGTGAGHAAGEVIYVGTATDAELAGKDLHGKLALVDRSMSFHRSIQYRNLAHAGALAMLYVSTAPQNLRQVGSVRLTGGDEMGAIPALTIGHDDGDRIKAALTAGSTVAATADVSAAISPGQGRNVVGRIEGTDGAHGQIVIGAHYDTWFAGAVDNGGGVAALLALAARRVQEPAPRKTLVFVAYDGEEVGLYGGYDYLRKHTLLAADPIVAFINFEMPSSKNSALQGLAYSNTPALGSALRLAGLPKLYPFFVTLDFVPPIFGGVIPTDIQGMYRGGLPAASTATDSSYYHTVADTADQVDVVSLAKAVDDFDLALGQLDRADASGFAGSDPALWKATVTLRPRTPADPVVIDVTITDANGAPQGNTTTSAQLLVDDFFGVRTLTAMTDAQGKTSFTFAATDAAMGSGSRFVHVTSGQTYPLVERIIALP